MRVFYDSMILWFYDSTVFLWWMVWSCLWIISDVGVWCCIDKTLLDIVRILQCSGVRGETTWVTPDSGHDTCSPAPCVMWPLVTQTITEYLFNNLPPIMVQVWSVNTIETSSVILKMDFWDIIQRSSNIEENMDVWLLIFYDASTRPFPILC